MKIELNQIADTLCMTLDGRLDTTTAPDFEKALNDHLDGIDALAIDCEKLAYISSAGLRVLLGAQKKMMDKMKLTKVGELVMEVFEMTGFADILTIE